MSKKPTAPAATQVATVAPQLPAEAGTFADFGGMGFEAAGRDDLAIPFLTILQGLSPEVKRSDGAYIDGAQEGMILNTVTKEVINTEDTELIVIPCAYVRSFVEWRVRERGGGFVAEHPVSFQPGELFRDDKGRDIMTNGNQLNDTRTFYVLLIDPHTGAPTPAVINMTSTQIKKSKQWLMQQNLLRLAGPGGKTFTPPMMASRWKVETVPESNEKGSWYGWKFTHAGYLNGASDPVFQAAVEFHKSVTSGEKRADMARANGEATDVDPPLDGGTPGGPDPEF